MHVLILGATSRSGQLLVDSVLAKGHKITALVRKPDAVTAKNNLKLVTGSPLQQADIQAAFDSATKEDPITAVLVTVALPLEGDSPFGKPLVEPTFMSNSVQNAMAVMKTNNTKRLIVMSTSGTGTSCKTMPYLFRFLFKVSNLRLVLEDHDRLDKAVRNSQGIEWTMLRPVMLKDGPAQAVKKMGEVGNGIGMLSSVTRASVAETMVEAFEDPAWIGKTEVLIN